MDISNPDYMYEKPDSWLNIAKYEEQVEGTSAADNVDIEYCCVIIGNKVIPKDTLHEYTQYLDKKNNALLSGIQKHVEQLLNASVFPKSWVEEGINKPNAECKKEVLRISTLIFDKYNLLPIRVAPSVEEGILLTYWEEVKNKTLKIEFYNDLDMVGLINQNKEIITSLNIKQDLDIFSLADKFIT